MKLDQVCRKNDECYTPEYAVVPLLKYIKSTSTVWCPFDTEESHFVKCLKKEGHTVVATHINIGVDFFTCDVPFCDYVVSNPPYSLKTKVFRRLFAIQKPFAMLVGVVGLFESEERFSMFANNPFEIMYFNRRIAYFGSYQEQKPSLNPPFSSVFLCSQMLPKQIVFERINKSTTKKTGNKPLV